MTVVSFSVPGSGLDISPGTFPLDIREVINHFKIVIFNISKRCESLFCSLFKNQHANDVFFFFSGKLSQNVPSSDIWIQMRQIGNFED